MSPFPVPDLPGLRPWRAEDAPVLVAAWADPDIARWCAVPDDAGLERAERWIAGWEERRQAGLALDLAVVEDEAVVGEVGLAPLRGQVTDVVELGWWVLPAHRGRGVATRAVSGLAGWAVDALPDRRVVARIPAGNGASERVATAAGLVLAGDLDDGTRLWRL